MYYTITSIGDKEYGFSIDGIESVLRLENVTGVPDATGFVEGVINYKNHIVPVINLKKKFAEKQTSSDCSSRIIIVKRDDGHYVGLVVDDVKDVLFIDPALIETPDELMNEVTYLSGVATVEDRIIMTVDIQKLLSSEETMSLDKIHQSVKIRKKKG